MSNNRKLDTVVQRRLPGFKKNMESVPGHYLVLTPEFIITHASDIFLKNTMSVRDHILGRNVFDVFPANPDDPAATTGVDCLKSSFIRVLERRALDMMYLVKYDIPKPSSKGGAFEERYWNPVNFPLFDKKGNLTHIIHNSEDVTKFVLQERLLSSTS